MNKSIFINKIEYIIEDTIQNDDFVGLKIIDGKYHLFLPLGFELKEDNESYYVKVLRYLYKTIRLTKDIDNDYEYDINRINEKSIPIDSYLYILSDYFSNGLINYNEVKYKNDMIGKVNWKRTFKNNFYVSDKKPVYLNTVIRYNKKETNIITLLQLYCVNKAVDILVFLGSFNKPYSELNDIDIVNNIDYYNNIIDKELRSTNNDKKKLLLVNIKSIINDCSNSDKFIRSFGTINYKYAFEEMIRKIFGNIEDLSEYYPKALWFIDDDEKGFESSSMREDSIWKGNNSVYIIDSKYYRCGVTDDKNDLPKTSDIHKQIVYGDFVINKLKVEESIDYKHYNIFLIPSNKKEFIEYKGHSSMKLLDNDDVHLCLVNMNEVIDRYFEKEYNQIEKLIEIIEKKCNKEIYEIK